MSQAGSLGSTFDLNSQSGVMAVLVAVRQSALSSAQKSELRDLVFQYSNGGGDVTVRRALEQKIATYGLVPVAPATTASVAAARTAPPPPRAYGTTRPAPQFAPVSVSVSSPVQPRPQSVATQSPVSTPAQSVTVPPVSVPQPAAGIDSVRQSVPVSVSTPSVPTDSTTPPPSVVAATSPTPTSTVAPVATVSAIDAALARIRDIKAAVNQKVGNPVNLVDIDNAIGREYMVAMLEAMKRVSGNGPGDVAVAMARLEAAFQAVEAAIAAHESAAAPAAVPTPLSSPSAVSAPAPSVEEVAMPEPAMTVSLAPEVPAPTPVLEVPVPPPPTVQSPSPTVPVSSPSAPASVGMGYAAMAPEPEAVSSPVFRAASLAEDPTPLRTPQDLPDPASLATSSVSGDPLFTKEVDAGLEQLLSEWVIFKKSGLFGTGPRGREHPLFKTVAPLTIPIILAGRYDGATPEIRQSITDYMNGWRYEQGIVYEQDETFEHYLRRVIHHIIDLQKRRRQA